MQRLEEMILLKLETKLNKLKACCLTLVAHIIVANIWPCDGMPVVSSNYVGRESELSQEVTTTCR